MITHGAIKTRYIGPTDTKGPRIRVTYKDVSHSVPRDSSADDSHAYAVAQVLQVPISQLVYREDWKLGKYFDLLEAPPKEYEFAFYVMSPTAKIAGFNSEMLAREYLHSLNEVAIQLNNSIWTRKQLQEHN